MSVCGVSVYVVRSQYKLNLVLLLNLFQIDETRKIKEQVVPYLALDKNGDCGYDSAAFIMMCQNDPLQIQRTTIKKREELRGLLRKGTLDELRAHLEFPELLGIYIAAAIASNGQDSQGYFDMGLIEKLIDLAQGEPCFHGTATPFANAAQIECYINFVEKDKGYLDNLTFNYLREHLRKMTPPWFLVSEIQTPSISMMRDNPNTIYICNNPDGKYFPQFYHIANFFKLFCIYYVHFSANK